jgi:hypothetical protein
MKRKAIRINDDPTIGQFARLARSHLTGSLDRLLIGFTDESRVGARGTRTRNADENDLLRLYYRLRSAAEALAIWHSSDDFLGPDGAPKPLSRSGPRSLTSLARRVDQRSRTVNQIVTDLERMQLVEKVSSGYIPARRSAVVELPNSVSLAYATKSISRLIDTLTHNYSRPAMPRFERQVAEVSVREVDLPLFLRFVEQQGQYLIDAVDDWLSKRRVASSPRGRSVSVGMGAFAWVDKTQRGSGARPTGELGAAAPR